MNIVHIKTEKAVKKNKKEIEREQKENPGRFYICDYKSVTLKEPIYVVEMSMEELKLVSFYLELEKRMPIMNVEIDAKLKGE